MHDKDTGREEHPMYQKVLSTLVTASSTQYSHYLAMPMVHWGGRHTSVTQLGLESSHSGGCEKGGFEPS